MRKRLFAVALTALIPATGMLIYNEAWYRSQRDAKLHSEALQASRQVASEVDRIFEGAKSLLTATAVVPSVTGDDTQQCNSVLAEIAGEVPSIATISMVGLDGTVLCSSAPNRNGTNIADRPYFQQATQSADFVVGVYTRGRVSGADVLPVAKAVNRGGRLRGVLVAGLKLSWFQARIDERGTLRDGFISIADKTGVVVARTPPLAGVIGTKISENFMHLLTAARPGTLEASSREGIERVIGYQPVTAASPLYIAAGFSKAAAFEDVNRGTLTAALLILLSGVVAALAAVFIGNSFITRPINRVVSVIGRWAEGDIGARTGMHGRYGEIGQVGVAVDGLLDELDRRRIQTEEAEAGRAFLARELSHRVKNSLSVVQAIARQTFGKFAPPQAIDTFSLRIRALAGAYDTLLAEEWESADVRDVVERALAPHHEPEDGRFRLEGPHFILSPKAVIAVSLILHELATNAAKYGALSDVGGHVGLTWQKAGSRIRLQWTEHDGPPVIPPEREGFGTKVVSRAFGAEFAPEVNFDFRPEGLRFCVAFTADEGLPVPSASDDTST
jgi:two-component sensor histidine kinase